MKSKTSKLLLASILTLGGVAAVTSCTPSQPEVVLNPAINLTGAVAELPMGQTVQLTASLVDCSGEVEWSSSNTAVATVSQTGLVTAQTVYADTSVTITVSLKSDSSVKSSVTFVVKNQRSLMITNSTENLDMLSTLQLGVNVVGVEDTSVVWTSSNTAVATVDATGLVTPKSIAADTTVTITATSVADSSLTDSVTITVKYHQTVFVKQISKKQSFVDFESKKNASDSAKSTYVVKNREFVAGDDNALNFKPKVSFINEDEEDITYTGDWNFKVSLQVKGEDGTFSAVESNAYVDTLDAVNCTIDFNEAAVGKTFKLVVEPEGLTANQKGDTHYDDYYKVVYNISVIDGFNVYSARDFAYFENRSAKDGLEPEQRAYWETYKSENNINASISYSKFILQQDISFQVSDLPSGFFWDGTESNFPTDPEQADRLLGSMKDFMYLYKHVPLQNEKMYIKGNYFTLDCSSLPLITWDDAGYKNPEKNNGQGDTVVGHSSLFFTEMKGSDVARSTDNTTNSSFEITDVNLLGNAPRSDQFKYGGGLIFAKHAYAKTKYENVLSNSWFVTYFPNYNLYDDFLIENCKSYDNYSNFVYQWAGNLEIKNSVMRGCGGPIIISDDVTHNNTTHNPPKVRIDSASVLESYVNGTEGWFQSYTGATNAAAGIIQMDGLFNAAGRSFLKTSAEDQTKETRYFNFIILVKNGSTAGLSNDRLRGSVQVENEAEYNFNEGTPTALDYSVSGGSPKFDNAYENATTYGYPFFKSSTGGLGAYKGEGTSLTNTSLAAGGADLTSEAEVFKGNHLGLYYQGMLIFFGYYNFNLANYVGGTNPYTDFAY